MMAEEKNLNDGGAHSQPGRNSSGAVHVLMGFGFMESFGSTPSERRLGIWTRLSKSAYTNALYVVGLSCQVPIRQFPLSGRDEEMSQACPTRGKLTRYLADAQFGI
jgi:hypothetical protein